MYGDGNATKVVRDVMTSTNQIVDGVREATGLDLTEILRRAVSRAGDTDTAAPTGE